MSIGEQCAVAPVPEPARDSTTVGAAPARLWCRHQRAALPSEEATWGRSRLATPGRMAGKMTPIADTRTSI
ncbi:hypothetical protein PF005_g12794 [Phytophthora fragariae]|uniref:Uncharacterized protein n=1 Tax=Phytophthora fragariae TaxID=53985 RepID=A0A6A3ERL5_9STRA|nr:hypothetical protein PF009_g14011 [Phytophthora fragariae]KAE9008339.1 hypothetical protein PF011_g10741 [Phytophthora fragariae]KAE9090933.1 hypothetical protein PF010_g18393 [Phytophthora fragariae]KAE9109650.1 hypothetical protein PF007_g12165 [Phytophthora fragariae]KAE9143862.1 hypothetical protein PF006_g11148 [Phytophthora fragariae]